MIPTLHLPSRQKTRRMPPPRQLTGLFVVAAAIMLGGCANVPQQAGFHTISKTIHVRTGNTVVWVDNSKADAQVQAAVKKLLAHPLSVSGAVQIALLNNQTLQADYESLGVSEANLVQAGLLHNPVFSIDLRFPARPYHGWDASIDQTFLDLLFMSTKKKIARAEFAARQALVTADILALAARTRKTYYQLQADEQIWNLNKTISLAAHNAVRFARRLRQAGNIAAISYDQKLALYQQARLAKAESEARVLEDRQRLNSLMGVWGLQTQWTVASRLPAIPEAPTPLAGLESVAIKNSLAIAAARSQLLAAAQSMKLSGAAGLLSGATVGLDYVRDPDVASTLGPALSIPLPIFNQGQPAMAKARARYLAECRRINALAVNLRAQVRRRWVRMTAAQHMAIFYQKIMLPLRRRIFNETQLAYNGMYTGPYPLLLARQDEIRTARRMVQAAAQYWIARAALTQTLNGPLPLLAKSAAAAKTKARPADAARAATPARKK